MRLPIALLCLNLLAGCDSAPLAGDVREPRCLPRSNTDPGRLNIDSGSEGFGYERTCRSTVSFYIARNTPLRGIEALLTANDGSGRALAERRIGARLEDNGSGMLGRDVPLEVEGEMCAAVRVRLSDIACLGENGEAIECPEIRLKTSYAYRNLMIETDGLDVCFDD